MEKLILADNTEIQILGGASMGSISTEVEDWTTAGAVIAKLTEENLKKLKFASGEDVSGEYTDMTLITPLQYTPGSPALLTFGVREGMEEEHAGTHEDPIPVPDTATTAGMEYEYGKYYSENGTVYLCKRGGVENPEEMYGQKETLYYAPSKMVGQYFEEVE